MKKQELVDLVVNARYPDALGVCVCAGPDHIEALIELLERYSHIKGIVIEVGVWRGGLAKIMSECLPDKKLYLFDTFEGIPYANEKDNFHIVGHFKETDLEFVQNFIGNFDKTFFVKGVFPSTLKEIDDTLNLNKIAIAHLDVDVYQSYKESLAAIYNKMQIGGIVILDDYNVESCAGATIAVDEFLADKPEKLELYKSQYYFEKK
jgi:O-methyltransferase